MIKQKYSGFTLIELLIVISLLAITMGITSDILLSLTRSYGKTQILSDVEQSANFATLKLEKEIRSAISASTLGSFLVLVQPSNSCVRYFVTNNVLYRSSSQCGNPYIDVPITANTSGGVSVTCSGNCFTVTGTSPQVVSYQIIFSQPTNVTGSNFSAQVVSKNSIVLRNTY